jgi:phosphatidate cytidylyltransferase
MQKPQTPPPAPLRHIDRKNLGVRLGTAFVFAAFFLTLLYLGDRPAAQAIFALFLAAALFMGAREFVLMGRKLGYQPSLPAGALAGWLLLAHFLLQGLSSTDPLPLWLALTLAGAVIHFSALWFDRDLGSALTSQAITWLSALYLGLGLGFQLRLFLTAEPLSNMGGRLIFALYLIVWLGDTGAYFVGSLLGRHKLAPRVSPKKTWEGVLGNYAGNLGAACIVKATLFAGQWSAVDAVAIALLLGTVGQLGDLVESTWKRSAGVKDSNMGGVAIPGHGGLLDRIDSLVFAAPALYAYVHLVHGLS